MLTKILVFLLWLAVLVVVDRFLIDSLWWDLVFTAIWAGLMTIIMGKVGQRES
ncbi:hypothetical protein G3I60_19225 [Streptomyces sp. SID13666]|uniref:hypothetical protein n=1 Tax=unclassified Streptomyces TaxID=2593676 RepID=UPI0013C00632|nr:MULTISPECIES: hypothetical protein [unclassified Streptomyces]NEA56224.1 hypothetical protein [Streptomyces sp. SID13666]NEA71895.1 hypothetical protein [Streptomyces sp. SID13588]